MIFKDYKTGKLESRTITIGKESHGYMGNKISSSKYNLVNFLPLSLYEQFSKPPNLYFLLIGVLQIFDEVTNSDGVPTIYLPLGIVILASIIKNLVEDFQRHIVDRDENNRLFYIMNGTEFFKSKSSSIRAGKIIKIMEGEQIPADILVLKSSGQNESFYLSTWNLDGETNSKLKSSFLELAKIINDSEEKILFFQSNEIQINYEKENTQMYNFQGLVEIEDKKIQVPFSSIALRGTFLKDTDYIIGVVLYAGLLNW